MKEITTIINLQITLIDYLPNAFDEIPIPDACVEQQIKDAFLVDDVKVTGRKAFIMEVQDENHVG